MTSRDQGLREAERREPGNEVGTYQVTIQRGSDRGKGFFVVKTVFSFSR